MPKSGERRYRGGRASRYDDRRAARGATDADAPQWTAAAAQLALQSMLELCAQRQETEVSCIMNIMLQQPVWDAWHKAMHRTRATAPTAVACAVLRHHAASALAAGAAPGTRSGRQHGNKALRYMKKWAAGGRSMAPLIVDFGPPATDRSFHEWLTVGSMRNCIRDISVNHRILDGIKQWDLSWLTQSVTICYERAAARIKAERPGCGGAPDVAFLRGVVYDTVLNTALANPGDHYVLLAPGRSPRFWSVEEVSRAFAVPWRSPLMVALCGGDLTEVQAVAALGGGVHCGVMRGLLKLLVAEGHLKHGATYGSAYSGIDMIAAALDEELGGQWSYSFASEQDTHRTAALLRAWGRRGLTAEACAEDARSEEAAARPYVDVFALTAECRAHADSNRGRDTDKGKDAQVTSLVDIDASLSYVRRMQPGIVIVENVTTTWAVLGISDLLGGIDGYHWRTAAIDPHVVLGEPVHRLRQFWVGVYGSDGK